MFKIASLVFLSVASLAAAQSGYSLLGCYSDSSTARALHEYVGTSSAMTVETCLSMCANVAGGPTALAGLEYGGECYCGNALLNEQTAISDSSCHMACSGAANETCGGGNALSLYQYAGSNFTSGSPTIVPSYKSWTYYGCWEDSPSARQIPNPMDIPVESMTVETCLDACAAQQPSMDIAGLQYAQECWCSRAALPTGPQQNDSACSMQCTDDANEFCGAGNLNSVYILPGAGVPKGCTAVCPASIVDLSDPRRVSLQASSVQSDLLICRYVDYTYHVQDTCVYDSTSGLLVATPDYGQCPRQTTCTPN